MSAAARRPPRKVTEKRLVVASHNQGKVREIRELLKRFDIETVSAAELNLPEPDETGTSFRENAELKARAAATASGLLALADDSGLSVTALGGQPGIHSARWAGEPRDFAHAMEKVEQELARSGTPDRTARFICGLALAWPQRPAQGAPDLGEVAHVEYVEGEVKGTLIWPPRGTHGFGYDPMFVPDDYDITFGEMDAAEKHRISHRADAFAKLVAACFV